VGQKKIVAIVGFWPGDHHIALNLFYLQIISAQLKSECSITSIGTMYNPQLMYIGSALHPALKDEMRPTASANKDISRL
jgi:hypothetical protein